MIKVKICGITRYEDANVAVNSGADAIGFIFAESKRKIDIKCCAEIIKNLPPFVYTVGVFMNNSASYINYVLDNCYLSALQFHGNEDENFCLSFNKPVIKAFSINNNNDLLLINNFPNIKNILIDGPKPGAGKIFDHKLLKEINKNKNIILAGGLNPDNIEKILKETNVYWVDVSSGVEKSPGIKDQELIEKFLQKVKK